MPDALVQGWLGREPVASLLLVVIAFLIFGQAFSARPERLGNFRTWVQGLAASLARAVLFLGLAGAFYFLLNSGYSAFSRFYGSFTTGTSLSHAGWRDWGNRYGGSLTQQDLLVTQYVRKETIQAFPTTTPNGPALYRTATIEEPIPENSITAFDGQVSIQVVDPQHPDNRFNAYTLSADYRYQILNPTETATRAEFRFLLPDTRLLQDLHVRMDGQELPSWGTDSGAILWETTLQPGQQAVIEVHYTAQGMDNFIFDVPSSRQVTDFRLRIVMNEHNC